MAPVSLRGGDVLFEAGSPADCLYLLRSGSLGAFDSGEGERLLGQVMAGETVGEVGVLTGRTRNATVRALRDSELARLGRDDFDELARRDPGVVRGLASLAVERASRPHAQRLSAAPRTLCLLPQHEGLDVHRLASELAAELSRHGRAIVVDATSDVARDPSALAALEADHRHVLYVASASNDSFRELCLRQADALVFVAGAGAEPAPFSELHRDAKLALPRPEHLVVLHPSGELRLGAGRLWSERRPTARLHHVRAPSDAARVARLVSGRSTSLVLSGGGARGFAHLGVIRALRESGIPVDAVGGTSIGSIVGAGIAADWSVEAMTEGYRRAFVAQNPLSDYTFPFVSLVSGRKVSRLLRETYGARDIEDLLLPFYCVSANLTAGRAMVHRRGPLWQWLRASVAIPGVLPPVFHRGHVFVDGGIINNLPVDVMRESQAGDVIAVDIGSDDAVGVPPVIEEHELPSLFRVVYEWLTGRRRPSILQIMLRAGMINASVATTAARSASTLVLAPPLGGVDLLEWKAFDRAIAIGYEHTMRALEDRATERLRGA